VESIKERDIIKCKVTGLQKYGAFVVVDKEHNGLIHISEISYGFVKDIEDYLSIGDSLYAEVIDVDKDSNNLKLSIKDIDYKTDGSKLKRMSETKNGFRPLKDNLDRWIDEKIKEITDKI
jgi:general stress protein 13